MPHRIESVRPRSIAQRHGVKAGDIIDKINGEPIIDDIDYQALTARTRVVLSLIDSEGNGRTVTIIKPCGAPLGITMGESLALTPRVCRNHCVFCFIDQMPPGMRRSLYVKDDDWRLSLMMGNFVTLTNVDDQEFARILRRKASPLYISIHATNPDARVKMMRNPFAAHIMERLTLLKEAGLHFHCQIVLCPSFNDGTVLDDTLSTLSSLYPAALSAALVPVGLTKYREKLAPLHTYDKEGARAVIRQAEEWQTRLLAAHSTRFVFPADEFYCKAELPLPSFEAYEGFPQIENGVGLLRKFEESLKERSEAGREAGERGTQRRVLIACGTSVAATMRHFASVYGPCGPFVEVRPILNRFFGETVTVTGLLTGGDILEQVRDAQADEILICRNTLRAEGDLFLDDMPLNTLRAALLPRKLIVVENSGASLYEALLGTGN